MRLSFLSLIKKSSKRSHKKKLPKRRSRLKLESMVLDLKQPSLKLALVSKMRLLISNKFKRMLQISVKPSRL